MSDGQIISGMTIYAPAETTFVNVNGITFAGDYAAAAPDKTELANVVLDQVGTNTSYKLSGTSAIQDISFSTLTGKQGAALYLNGDASTTYINEVIFTGNSTSGDGAAVYNYRGTAYITNSTFTGNTTSGHGAVHNDAGTLYIGDVTFTNNNCNGANGGGAISNNGATMVVIGKITLSTASDTIRNGGSTAVFKVDGASFFDENSSSNIATVIDAKSGTWGNSTTAWKKSGNAVTDDGYALFSDSTGMYIVRGAYTAAAVIASTHAPAVQFANGTVYAGTAYTDAKVNSAINDNSVTAISDITLPARVTVADGKTLYAEKITASGLTVTDGNNGGAITVSGTANISKSYFSGNTGTRYSGAVNINDGKVTISGSTFLRNCTWDTTTVTSTRGGGAIGVSYGASGELNVIDSLFDSNFSKATSGGFGGGAILANPGLVTTISGSTFSNNISGDNKTDGSGYFGGAVDNFGTMTITGSTFTGNYGSNGGAIRNTGTLNIGDVTFDNNQASEKGGAIYSDGTLNIIGKVTLATQNDTIYIASGKVFHIDSEKFFAENVTSGVTTVVDAQSGTWGSSSTNWNKNATATTDDGHALISDATGMYIIRGEYTSAAVVASNHKPFVYFSDGTLYAGKSYTDSNIAAAISDNAAVAIRGITVPQSITVNKDKNLYAEKILIDNLSDTTGRGGAIKIAAGAGGEVVLSGSTFSNNTALRGGGAIAYYQTTGARTLKIYDSLFEKNTSNSTEGGYGGGAISAPGGWDVTISGTTFSENKQSGKGSNSYIGGAIDNKGVMNISGSTFYKNSSSVNGGAVYNSGTLTIGNVIFDSNEAVDGSGGAIYSESSSGSLIVNGKLTLTTAQDTIFITSNTNHTFKIDASGFFAADAASGVATVIDAKSGTWGESDTPWKNADAVAATTDAGHTLISDATGMYIIKGAYTAAAVIASTHAPAVQFTNGAIYAGTAYTDAKVNAAINNNAVTAISGITLKSRIDVSNGKTLFADKILADGFTSTDRGAAIILRGSNSSGTTTVISNSTFSNNAVNGGAASRGGAAISFAYGAIGSLTVTNSLFDRNSTDASSNGYYGGAICATSGTEVAITGSTFSNNSAPNAYGGAINIHGNAVISDTLFVNNFAGLYGGAIFNNGSLTITGSTFATARDSIYNNNSKSLLFTGENFIAASITHGQAALTATVNGKLTFINSEVISIGSMTFETNAALNFTGSAAVKFIGTQDWSKLPTVTVDGSTYLNESCNIAQVAGNFQYDLAKIVVDEKYTLFMQGSDLYIRNAATTVNNADNNVKVVGSGDNLFTGKASGSFFAATAQQKTGDSIISTITGEVGGTVIGGQWANGSTGYEYATGGDVTLNLNGAQIGNTSHVYGGGYMYGDNKAKPETAQMKVDKVNMTLSGDDTTAKGLLFGGIHAREYGYAEVGEVNITVDGGTYGRIHGGGWAEKGAYSVVNSVNINVKSGTIDYIYAGGCNATTEANYQTINGTLVGTANITIDSAATVTYVYLGARYAAGKIDGDVTLTVTGEDKTAEIRRITGWGSTGMDSSENGNSIVKLETDVNTVYFDYVDQLTINENCTLNIEDSASFGSGQDIEIDLALDADGLTKSWDIITGAGVAGIMDAVSSFQIGTEIIVWEQGKVSGSSDSYTLTYDTENNKLSLNSKLA